MITFRVVLLVVLFVITNIFTEAITDDKILESIKTITDSIQDLRSVIENSSKFYIFKNFNCSTFTFVFKGTIFETKLINLLVKISEKHDNYELKERLDKLENKINGLSIPVIEKRNFLEVDFFPILFNSK